MAERKNDIKIKKDAGDVEAGIGFFNSCVGEHETDAQGLSEAADKSVYSYRGPILRFGKIYVSGWVGETEAATDEKALSNLKHQAKADFNMPDDFKIDLDPSLLVCHGSFSDAQSAKRCPDCGTLLSDGGYCPKCYDGEERLDEGVEQSKIDEIDAFIDSLYELRHESIDSEGEFGIGNLVFKEMRSLGYLDNLRDIKKGLNDRRLSLESLNEDLLLETRLGTTMLKSDQFVSKIIAAQVIETIADKDGNLKTEIIANNYEWDAGNKILKGTILPPSLIDFPNKSGHGNGILKPGEIVHHPFLNLMPENETLAKIIKGPTAIGMFLNDHTRLHNVVRKAFMKELDKKDFASLQASNVSSDAWFIDALAKINDKTEKIRASLSQLYQLYTAYYKEYVDKAKENTQALWEINSPRIAHYKLMEYFIRLAYGTIPGLIDVVLQVVSDITCICEWSLIGFEKGTITENGVVEPVLLVKTSATASGKYVALYRYRKPDSGFQNSGWTDLSSKKISNSLKVEGEDSYRKAFPNGDSHDFLHEDLIFSEDEQLRENAFFDLHSQVKNARDIKPNLRGYALNDKTANALGITQLWLDPFDDVERVRSIRGLVCDNKFYEVADTANIFNYISNAAGLSEIVVSKNLNVVSFSKPLPTDFWDTLLNIAKNGYTHLEATDGITIGKRKFYSLNSKEDFDLFNSVTMRSQQIEYEGHSQIICDSVSMSNELVSVFLDSSEEFRDNIDISNADSTLQWVK